MKTLTLDFETYYSSSYSLSKLSPIEYIRGAEFKVHGCSFKIGNNEAYWISGDNLQAALNTLQVDNYLWIAHNGLFDYLILAEEYNIRPTHMADTLSMARGLLPPGTIVSLDNLTQLFKLGTKGKELVLSKGLRDLPPDIELQIADYACNDADLCYLLYLKLIPYMPPAELRLINTIMRWGTHAVLELNIPLLEEAKEDAKATVIEKLVQVALGKTQLRSNKQFAAWLKEKGYTPPMRISPSTGKLTWAFGKDSIEYQDFKASHPELRTVLEAKEAVSSRIEETRAERMIFVGTHGNNKMIMPLNYYGADNTGRMSGAGKLNVQNLKRGSKLRRSIKAPEGYNILVADSSQIELRVNMWFCGQTDILDILRNNGDVYSYTASDHFGIPINKKTHPNERQFGKLLELACGYGMGHKKFRIQAALGALGTPKTYLSEQEAYSTIQNYRTTHASIKGMWDWLTKTIIPGMSQPGFELQYKCVKFIHSGIELPNGMMLLYPDLQCEEGNQWTFQKGNKRSKLYGGLLLENIIQALARIAVFEQMMVVEDRLPNLVTVSSTHDEFLALETIDKSQASFDIMLEEMGKSPTWAKDLPVTAEGGFDKCYSK